jgi:hypothetical protein
VEEEGEAHTSGAESDELMKYLFTHIGRIALNRTKAHVIGYDSPIFSVSEVLILQ